MAAAETAVAIVVKRPDEAAVRGALHCAELFLARSSCMCVPQRKKKSCTLWSDSSFADHKHTDASVPRPLS